jgi:hypothetical protein
MGSSWIDALQTPSTNRRFKPVSGDSFRAKGTLSNGAVFVFRRYFPMSTPKTEPRDRSDWGSRKQTDKPWKGNPEKEQRNDDEKKLDLERWQKSSTH